MIRPYTAIIRAQIEDNLQLHADDILAFEVSKATRLDLSTLRSAFFLRLNAPFMFFADEVALPLTPEYMNLVISFFFSRNYKHIAGLPAFLIQEEHQVKMLAPLVERVKMQGWSGVYLITSNKAIVSEEVTYIPQVIRGSEADVQTVFMECLETAENFIFFNQLSGAENHQEADTFGGALRGSVKDAPLNKLLDKYKQLKLEYQSTLQQLKEAQQENEIAHSFVTLAKSKYKEDYDLLFNFYQSQYEVLPLWYKRVGHIVKVLTGKRTLRSLYQKSPNPK